MKRRIILINEEACNGCGACVTACHEGAIVMKNGKATLLRDDYCDGLGDCLPACPTDAISFEEREAAAYDEAAVLVHIQKQKDPLTPLSSCPGMQAKALIPPVTSCPGMQAKTLGQPVLSSTVHIPTMTAPHKASSPLRPLEQNSPLRSPEQSSHLRQWPVQLKLVPVHAPYFNDAHLLIAADCTAYAYKDFHSQFMNDKITLIACPKLDEGDYSEKLTEIFRTNTIKSINVLRMEVPCCGGLEHAVARAIKASGSNVPWAITTISCNGNRNEPQQMQSM